MHHGEIHTKDLKKQIFFKQTYKQKKAAKMSTDFPIATI